MSKLVLVLIFVLSPALSFAKSWVTNPDHSEIYFQIPYMGVSEVTGRFNEFSGTTALNASGDFEKLEIQISASSIDTGNKMRDGHLKGSDFLGARQYPYITFRSHAVTRIRPNVYQAKGELTIQGITKPSVIEFSSTDTVKDTWGYENKFVKFKSSLNRKDYKITWNKTLEGKQFLVGDIVSFWGTFQIQPEDKKTPNSKHMIPDTEYIRERDDKRRDNGGKPLEEESAFSKKLRELINGK